MQLYRLERRIVMTEIESQMTEIESDGNGNRANTEIEIVTEIEI